MTRYWMAVASHEHVQQGRTGGFAQVCHGKLATLKYMTEGDWLIYYSPTYYFLKKDSCRRFTAIGKVEKKAPFTVDMNENFTAWRRNITYLEAQDLPIELVLDKLSFISNKQKWGFPFRRGSFEISHADFELIAKHMGLVHE